MNHEETSRQSAPTKGRSVDPEPAKTRKVKFYLELVEMLPDDVLFENGDVIEFEGHDLVVRTVEKVGAWTGHKDALRADLVVRLTPFGKTFAELRQKVRVERLDVAAPAADAQDLA